MNFYFYFILVIILFSLFYFIPNQLENFSPQEPSNDLDIFQSLLGEKIGKNSILDIVKEGNPDLLKNLSNLGNSIDVQSNLLEKKEKGELGSLNPKDYPIETDWDDDTDINDDNNDTDINDDSNDIDLELLKRTNDKPIYNQDVDDTNSSSLLDPSQGLNTQDKVELDDTKMSRNERSNSIPKGNSNKNNDISPDRYPFPSGIKTGRRSRSTSTHNTIQCKFYPSYSEGFVCPDKYPSHLGATFSAKANSGLLCNGKQIKTDRAKAYPIVKNGSIKQVKLIHHGSGYVGHPRILVRGQGKHAKLKAIVSSSGNIKKIEIINGGQGFHNTPKIIIEKPNGYVYCHLCCDLDTS